MKLIPLTRGQFAKVSDRDHGWLSAYKWYALPWSNGCGKFYAVRNQRDEDGRVRRVFMHRAIKAPAAGLKVDHEDGDGLNNQRPNLRVCTSAQNNLNRKLKVKERYRGVKQVQAGWLACITVDRRRVKLGVFKTAVLAAFAYDEAACRLRGRFAYTNFEKRDRPPEPEERETSPAPAQARKGPVVTMLVNGKTFEY